MNTQNFTILKNTDFFSALPISVLESLAKDAVGKQFKKGDLIIKEDSEATGCYILLTGSATVYSLNNQAGTKYIISKIERHSLVGELSVINSNVRPLFSVEANEDLECLFLKIDTFRTLLDTYPVVSQKLLPMVVIRLQQLVGLFFK